jgi:hypothetical protein
MTPFLAIDPGASGGLAWRDADGIVHAEPMPDGMTAQVDRLRSLAATLPGLTAVMEKVGTYVPGNHVGSPVPSPAIVGIWRRPSTPSASRSPRLRRVCG